MIHSELIFYVNGKKIVEKQVNPEWTLLYYLRNKLRLCGTKLGCGEGGCGACTVMISKYDHKLQVVKHFPVNACLAPICSMHGLAVTTVEGIGSTKTKLHPVQERIAKAHGLQCGFCTPGIVMSMYTLLRNFNKPTMKDMETSFQGNLCRCTGYRPIIEGYKSFTSDGNELMQNGYGVCGMGKDCCKLNGNHHNEDLDNQPKLFDPNTFTPYDPTQEPIFPPELKLYDTLDHQSLVFRGKNIIWYRPSKLTELLDLKHKYPEAKLVVGNTEVGVEIRLKHCVYPVIIQPSSIPELTEIACTENGIKIGAAVTLLELEDALKQQIKLLPEHKTRVFTAIKDMLQWFGGKQIRSVASIGGNIVTSSPISDLNPIFAASRVKLELSSKNGQRVLTMDDQFFTGYRKNKISREEVLISVHIPYTSKYQYFYADKQARRREDDIAVVNFALNVIFYPNTNIVSNFNLAFGGMAPTTVTAPTLCEFFIDKVWSKQILNTAYTHLLEDLPLPPNAPGGMTEYRRSLTLSLFFKAFLKVSDQIQNYVPGIRISETDKSAITRLEERIPKSSQLFEIYPDNGRIRSVGKPLQHRAGLNSATGQAVFCDDIPPFHNELYMALVSSTKAHAKIVGIDLKEALQCKGVHAFYSYKDLEKGRNRCGIGLDEEIFAEDVVRFQGQLIGVIIADDQFIAQDAAAKVKVTYQALEPVIVTIEDAIRHKSFFPPTPKIIEIGDIDKVFETAPHIIEGDCRTGAQEHFYLETHAVIAVPKGEDDEMEIFCTTQHPTGVSESTALLLGVPQNKIITKVKRLGGAFGGKDSIFMNFTLAAAFAASKLNRPIRCMLNRDEDMVMTGTRHPFYVKYKTAFDDDGKILGSEAHLYANAGYSLDVSPWVLERAMEHFENAYKTPAVRVVGYVCKTNLPSCTAFRAFGAPQAMLAGEQMIRKIAEFLKKDHIRVAYENLYKEGDLTNYKQRLDDCNLERCWTECLAHSNMIDRQRDIEKFNRNNRWKKRGISILPTRYGVGLTTGPVSQGGALLHIYTDGTILLNHGGVEMGQGLHTKMIQVASTALDVPHTKIHICDTSTDKVPNTTATNASLGSDLNGGAVLAAAKIIKERLEPFKKMNPKGKWEDWVKAAYENRVSLSTTGFYKTPTEVYSRETGHVYDYHTYGVACSEVEIDCLTGDHQVLRTDIVMDVGESLNPAIDIGQIEGAFMQGYGLFMQEEMLYSPKGDVLTRGPGSYKVPSFGNMPLEFNVSLLKGSSNPRAVYSSKAIGEPPVFLSCSVLFAVREAIKAARIDAGLPATDFKLDAPATSAKIRLACQDHLTAMVEERKYEGSFVPWNVVP